MHRRAVELREMLTRAGSRCLSWFLLFSIVAHFGAVLKEVLVSRHDCLGTAMNFILSLGWLKIKIYTLIVPRCVGGKSNTENSPTAHNTSTLWEFHVVSSGTSTLCVLTARSACGLSQSLKTLLRLVGKFMRRCRGKRRMLYNFGVSLSFSTLLQDTKLTYQVKKSFSSFQTHSIFSCALPPPSFDASSSVWMRK